MAERGTGTSVVWRVAMCAVGVTALGALASCDDMKRAWGQWRVAEERIEPPALLSTSLPFRYPPALFHAQTHGEVTLRLHVDSLGRVVPESTRIAEHAKHTAFDSAALEGASQLVFRPARRGNRPIGHTVLFPIRFRVPGAVPSARDTTRHRP